MAVRSDPFLDQAADHAMSLGARFTLVVPTYNRPQELGRLVGYLARRKAPFPILVADSSDGDTQAANAALLERLDVPVRVLAYPPSMTPWEKFLRVSHMVQTEYCALCADDDVVLVDALEPLLGFLGRRLDYVAVHGWYFNFYCTDHFGITEVVYSGPSLDHDDPVRRLGGLFSRYEAITYAVYRTDTLRRVLRSALGVESLLARELLASALTGVAGKVARCPILYYGRALRPSHFYDRWHPLDYLITSPRALFAEYAAYREILLDALLEDQIRGGSREELAKVVDLVHLRYLSEYARPEVMEYLISEIVAGAPKEEIMRGVWPRLSPGPSPLLNRLRQNRFLRDVRDRFLPRLRLDDIGRFIRGRQDRIVTATTDGGRPRVYRLYRAFLEALPGLAAAGTRTPIEPLLGALNAYE